MKIDFENISENVQSLLDSNAIYKAPVPVYSIARNLGLNIKFVTFKVEYSNIAGFIDFRNKPETIYVNASDCPERQAFTIAHEIGHFQLHKDLYEKNPAKYQALYRQAINKTDLSEEETEANCFAAQLLVPKKFYSQAKKDYPFASDSALAKLFGVSQDVIRYRILAFEKGWN